MPPANFRGHLSKSSQEPTLSSCPGQLPFPRRAGEDGPSREALTWSRSLRDTPRAERLSSVPAVPSTAPSPQQCTHLSTQHVLPMAEGGHGPFSSDMGPLGDGSCGMEPPLACGSSCPSVLLPAAPQAGPYPMARGARPQPQLPLPPRGSEGHRGGGGHQVCLNYCNNDMFFNLCPLR